MHYQKKEVPSVYIAVITRLSNDENFLKTI